MADAQRPRHRSASVTGPVPRANCKRVAAHEATRRVGLVELLAPNHQSSAPRAPSTVSSTYPATCGQGCSIRFLPTSPLELARPFGNRRRRRVQQQTWRADTVAGEDHHLRRLELLIAVRVVVDRARRHAVFIGGDLTHPAARSQFHAGPDRKRPVGDVSAGLGTLSAAGRAVPDIDARLRVRHTPWLLWRYRTATSASQAGSARWA